ncbi:MAG: galactose mutarotase [Desulfofustis sp.]|nr:galactose mutarotase [Desulfofustis sp.]
MRIQKEHYGRFKDSDIDLYHLIHDNGSLVSITNFGGLITSIRVPDRSGELTDVVLGYDTLDEYIDDRIYIGSLVGRYANRIRDGKVEILGETYQLSCNRPSIHLHGGNVGFNKKVWTGEGVERDGGCGVELALTSPDGEEGFPGTLKVRVRYLFTPASELVISYRAETDKPTIVNLTQHSYFNLAGGGSVAGHHLSINGSHITPVGGDLIPTGALLPVEKTPFNFKNSRRLGAAMAEGHEQKPGGAGFDHNYVLDTNGDLSRVAASLHEPVSGRTMEVRTTKPGLQLYTGNYLNGTLRGRGGATFDQHGALCLETQYYPDSPNQPTFPSPVLLPGEIYRHTTVYRFGCRG